GRVRVTGRAAGLTASECARLVGRARPGRFVELTIADAGPGVAPASRRRPFAEPVFSPKPRHRGVGLVSAFRLLCAAGGGVRVDSPPGGGAVARLALPAAPDSPLVGGK